MQIGLNLPRGKDMNGRPRGSGGQRSRSQEGGRSYVWKTGGDIILDPLSRVDRGMQWATETLPLKSIVAHRIKFNIATMTHKAIYAGNPHLMFCYSGPVAHCMQNSIRSNSANLLSLTRCNISFDTRGFRSAAPAIWNSLPSNVRSSEAHNSPPTPKISSFPLSLCHWLISAPLIWFVHDYGAL